MRALGVLLVWRGHAHHAAHLPIATQPGGEHAQHALSVEPVCLGPACSAVHQDAGRLKHIGSDAMRRQQSMQPKPVPAGLEAARHVGGAAQLGRGSRPKLSDEFEQRGCVAALQAVQPHF